MAMSGSILRSKAAETYERRKWEVRYEWIIETPDHHPSVVGLNKWSRLAGPIPFEWALQAITRHVKKYEIVRMRNKETGEVIPGDIFT